MIVSRWNNQTCEGKGESLSSNLIRGLIPLLSSSMFSYRSFLGWKEQQSSFFNLPFFLSPIPGRPLTLYASYVIYLFSIDLGHQFVDHAGCYLNACPICRLIQLVVSCSNQGDTVQGSFLH